MNVLFVCEGNSARSQMAQAFGSHLGNGRFSFHSAGTFPSREVHPLAIAVMQEKGIDISLYRPKSFTAVPKPLHFMIAICGQGNLKCPSVPGLTLETWDVQDPAVAVGTPDEQLALFRSVRDEIESRVQAFLIEQEGDRPPD